MPSESKPTKAVKLFVSYSHKDERHKGQLLNHLSPLMRQGAIERWDDREIEAGDEWEKELLKHFNEADMILCLISSSFISSDYCYNIEMRSALDKQKAGKVRVIPILLQAVDWKKTPFHELQIIPRDNKAILSQHDRPKAFTKVAEEIGKVVDALNARNA